MPKGILYVVMLKRTKQEESKKLAVGRCNDGFGDEK
jgi:hypothetical protein